MNKLIGIVMVLALVLGLSTAPLWGQGTVAVKGVVKDQNGKPLEGATVELVNTENGRKYDLKTNAKGEYQSIAILNGVYDYTLIKDGKILDKITKVPVTPTPEGEEMKPVNFDLSKQASGLTEEQKKKVETQKKESDKIKGLNASLAQAKQLESVAIDDQTQAKQQDADKNWNDAITVLKQATEVDPNQDLIWSNLGDAQRGAKKYPDAIESYQKAVAIKPTSGPYHNNLGDVYAKAGQTDKAVQEFNAAAEADPTNSGMYYFNTGLVLSNTGKMDEAIAAFDKAIQIDPNKAAAYYFKGTALVGKATTKGDKMVVPDGTAEAFNKYLQLDPNGPYAEGAKQMLAAIGAPVETSYGKSKTTTPPKKKQ